MNVSDYIWGVVTDGEGQGGFKNRAGWDDLDIDEMDWTELQMSIADEYGYVIPDWKERPPNIEQLIHVVEQNTV